MSFLFRLAAPAFVTSALWSCGAAECTGARLDDAKLCSLKCGETTFEEAKALLGPPTASANRILEYRATCSGGSEVLSLTLSFDSADKLLLVGRTGVGPRFSGGSLPSCLAACR